MRLCSRIPGQPCSKCCPLSHGPLYSLYVLREIRLENWRLRRLKKRPHRKGPLQVFQCNLLEDVFGEQIVCRRLTELEAVRHLSLVTRPRLVSNGGRGIEDTSVRTLAIKVVYHLPHQGWDRCELQSCVRKSFFRGGVASIAILLRRVSSKWVLLLALRMYSFIFHPVYKLK